MAFKVLSFIVLVYLVLQVSADNWRSELYRLANSADNLTDDAYVYLKRYENYYLSLVVTVEALEEDAVRAYYRSNSQPNITIFEECLNASAAEVQQFKDTAMKQIKDFQSTHDVMLASNILGGINKRVSFQRDWTEKYSNSCTESQSSDVCNENAELIVRFLVDLIQHEIKEFAEQDSFKEVAEATEALYNDIVQKSDDIIHKVVLCALNGQ